ncbi:CRP-like cAMP-binding protein [Algoriphagus sp. 4150]|uniref:Crp/Fnr family transcriptional regulator n=1 Tax=Algoriphagus sp. 4150 TaxID=2817756 RepID=UPI00285DF114|nr:Crp/Fnr family transcriptional regulator [Algoriphagus sp. 4150]MDR7132450.1 CRP-like cAMP-binding protein [Algoriphagus sp. 4150]
MELAEYFKQTVGLPEETVKQLDSLFDTVELPKGYELLREGSKSKKLFYMEKGLMRLFYLKDGKDITHHFFQERAMYMPIENVFLNQDYRYNIVLLENSVIRSVDFSLVEGFIDSDVKLQRLTRYLMVSVIKQLADHLFSLQFQTAKDRYSFLVETHPNILLRAPLGHIASYLGITQQTLSVIRAEKSI